MPEAFDIEDAASQKAGVEYVETDALSPEEDRRLVRKIDMQ